jgi:hypothetical protein
MMILPMKVICARDGAYQGEVLMSTVVANHFAMDYYDKWTSKAL